MRTAGIIAEYNPFHKGHQYQLDYTKETAGADYTVIVMSGDYVQRGGPALLPKHLRAEAALRCGADLVLELPVTAATASAEAFAGGGVGLLDALGVVDFLCFGSETGNVSLLWELAGILNEEPPFYREELRRYLREGLSYPASRSRALLSYLRREAERTGGLPGTHIGDAARLLPGEIAQVLSSPNDILGLEYCKALQRLHSPIRPDALERKGCGYHESGLPRDRYASASAIRELLEKHPDAHEKLKEQVPAAALSLIEQAMAGRSFVLEEDFDSILHYCLLRENYDSLCLCPDISPGLARRIVNRRNHFEGFCQFAGLLKTKEMTQTRIQRALLHIILHLEEVSPQVPYARVLGFRKSSGPLLSEIKKHSRIPLIAKLADAPALLGAPGRTVLEENTFASNVYQSILCHKSGTPFIHEFRRNVIIV